MTRVKICGITNLDDALAASELGADAVGFVLYPGSPRAILPSLAQKIIAELPPYVTTVGVFADQDIGAVCDMMGGCGFDLVQLQGDESPDFCRRLGSRVVKAIQVRNRESIQSMAQYSVRAFVLDTYREHQPGGTGQTFDWNLAVEAKDYGRIILAGGLTPENVRQAVDQVRPYAVDVSSGVEERPGKKDHKKIAKFIEAVKN